MKPVAVIASAAVSSLGRGRAAYDVGEPGDPPRSGLTLLPVFGGVRHPLVGRVALDEGGPPLDRAERLLDGVARELAGELDRVAPTWRAARVAVVIGTSSGAMQSIETALRIRSEGGAIPRELAEAANYFSPLRAARRAFGAGASIVEVLAACASSTIAIGIGCRYLESGRYDLVIAGGYDALSELVASGFDALRALTTTTLRPFRADRDGMALGEGAALVALELAERTGKSQGRVLGFGASSDAHHVTAPDPSGAGLERAARAALADAGKTPSDIELVSAHGTGTPFNDAAEARALASLFGARAIPVFPFKAMVGHTLGAAGALETLATFAALKRGCIPAVPGSGAPSETNVYLPATNEARSATCALKLSAAFGGANAALVLAGDDAHPTGVARVRRPVSLVRAGPFVESAAPELVARFARVDSAILSRLDGLSELIVSAVATLLAGLSELPGKGTAVVVASVGATLEQDEAFDARRRAGHAVEPRRFPATSPNLGAGWCGIAYGFQGPSFAVGGRSAPDDAVALAYELVAAGDAPAALAVVGEDSGPVVRDVFEAARLGIPGRGARAVLLADAGDRQPVEATALTWSGIVEG